MRHEFFGLYNYHKFGNAISNLIRKEGLQWQI